MNIGAEKFIFLFVPFPFHFCLHFGSGLTFDPGPSICLTMKWRSDPERRVTKKKEIRKFNLTREKSRNIVESSVELKICYRLAR